MALVRSKKKPRRRAARDPFTDPGFRVSTAVLERRAREYEAAFDDALRTVNAPGGMTVENLVRVDLAGMRRDWAHEDLEKRTGRRRKGNGGLQLSEAQKILVRAGMLPVDPQFRAAFDRQLGLAARGGRTVGRKRAAEFSHPGVELTPLVDRQDAIRKFLKGRRRAR